MAGEYYRWLAKDVKPEEKRELTRQEKVKNWWYYHKWHLLIAAAVIFLIADISSDILTNHRNQPDYSIAYVGSSYLPEDTVTQLTDALAQLGEDLNGNGTVQVALHQYLVYSQEAADQSSSTDNYSMLYTAQVQLAADLENCSSFFFLMEDPGQFQEDYQILDTPDGGLSEDIAGSSPAIYFAWTDCPVLVNLPLGDYSVETLDRIYTGQSQDVLSGLYIGRRGFLQGETCSYQEGCEALWNKLIQGATS